MGNRDGHVMGYENCGRREQYPYDQLLDGKPHVIRGDESVIRALRYGAARRSWRMRARRLSLDKWKITAQKVG